MNVQEYLDALAPSLWELRVLTCLQAVVLVLAAAALIKYLFFR
jgi:hypothetical protein